MEAKRKKCGPLWCARTVALALGLMVAARAEAQRGRVRGRVVDNETRPLAGVEILLEYQGVPRQRITVKTDTKGDFVQVGIPTGNYKVTYSVEGYMPVTQGVRVTEDGYDLGTVPLLKLPEGALSEKGAKAAQGNLDSAAKAVSKGDYQAAIASYQKFLELSPKNAEAHFNIATNYEKLGNHEEALAYYGKALELRPDLYEAYLAIAEIHAATQKWAEATAALKKALDLRPQERTLLFNYGAYAGNAGDTATARQSFEKLLELDPTHALAHYQLAMILLGQGENPGAIAHLENYLALAPEGPKAATAKEILAQVKKD